MRVYKGEIHTDYYLFSFLKGISLRRNCYKCQYAKPERIGDITLGDFIGLDPKVLNQYNAKNVSVVLTNSKKGLSLYQEAIVSMGNAYSIERDYAERLRYGPSLRAPFPMHPLTDDFKENYNGSFPETIRKIARKAIIEEKVIHYLNYWTYAYRIPRKIIRVLKNQMNGCKRTV